MQQFIISEVVYCFLLRHALDTGAMHTLARCCYY